MLKHRNLIVVQAYIKCKKKNDAGNPTIRKIHVKARFWETVLNKTKTMRNKVMQFTIR